MADTPNKGVKRPKLRHAELLTGEDIADLDQLDYISVFLSTEENWYKSPYGYSLAGALFARAFMRERRPTESLHGFGKRFRVGVPMIHKHATNSGNPTLNTMEEIARQKGLTLFEFLGFTPTEIKRAYRRIGLDFDAEQARAERINTHPRHLTMKRKSARAITFRQGRPELVEALGKDAPKLAAPWPPAKPKRRRRPKDHASAGSDTASAEPVDAAAIPPQLQPKPRVARRNTRRGAGDPHGAGSNSPTDRDAPELPVAAPSVVPEAVKPPRKPRRRPEKSDAEPVIVQQPEQAPEPPTEPSDMPEVVKEPEKPRQRPSGRTRGVSPYLKPEAPWTRPRRR